MAYIGNQPTEAFTTFATQTFSTSATSSYTLDHAVTNENEIALFVNNVRQQPGSGKAYTAAGTALTLSANTASTDTMYCVFLGRALQTVNPPDGSVATAKIAATAVTGAKLNTDVISAQTALATAPADTDELLISDAGVLKRIDYSLLKSTPTHVLISTTTVSSAVSEVNITSNIDSTYKRYIFHVDNLSCATNNAHLHFRFFQSGSIVSSSTYDWVYYYGQSNDSGFNGYASSQNDSYIRLLDEVKSDSDQTAYLTLTLYDPSNTTTHKRIDSINTYSRGGNINAQRVGGRIEDTTAVDGVRFFMASGNIDGGIIKMYGVA